MNEEISEDHRNVTVANFPTNDSIDQELDDPEEYNEVTQRSTGLDEEDLETNYEAERQPSQIKLKPTMTEGAISFSKQIIKYLNMAAIFIGLVFYNLMTSLILNFSVWLFVVLSMLFLIFKIVLQALYPAEEYGIFAEEIAINRRQRTARRRRPQSQNQRRISRSYQRGFTISQRRMNGQAGIAGSIPMVHISNDDSDPGHEARQRSQQRSSLRISRQHEHESDTDNQESNSARDFERLLNSRFNQLRYANRRTQVIRTALSLLNQQSSRGNDLSFLNNLHLFQTEGTNREFDSNDYEWLQSLDMVNTRPNEEILQLFISQLPTQVFKEKASPQKEGTCQEKTPEKEISDENQSSQHKNFCTICLNNFVDGETVKSLPCFHQYHSVCVDSWLIRKPLCPICKFDITSRQEESLEGLS